MRFVVPSVLCAAVWSAPLSAQDSLTPRAAFDFLRAEGQRALELADLRRRVAPLERTEIYQGVWLRESGGSDSVVFDFLPFASAPRAHDGVALAFDPGLGPRMWAGATDADPLRSAFQGTAARLLLGIWRGMAPPTDPRRLLIDRQQCPGMRLRLGAESAYAFGTDGRDVPPDTRAFLAYADCERRMGPAWRIGLGVRGYVWRTPGMADRHDVESVLRLARAPPGNSTLVFLDLSWTPAYHREVLHLERPLDLGRLHLRPFVRLASGERLPFGLGFWPGGFDGFPGLGSGERRGDREVTAAVDAVHPLIGPLSARTLLAVGRTAEGGPLFGEPGWLAGWRAGLNWDTRVGLIRLEYGRATGGHRAFFMRMGRLW